MRLTAKEDDIYKLMDQRDLCFGLAGFCGIAAGSLLLFIIRIGRNWEIIYLLGVLAAGTLLLLYRAWKMSRRIMEANRCYMELDEDSLAVYQPEQNGRYEACRIFYQEIEKIVEGSRSGIPEFYVVIQEKRNRESFILLDDEEQRRKIFCVRSLGYHREEFKKFYRRLRWEVPGKVRIIGTKYQSIWDRKKIHREWLLLVFMAAVYLLLKAGFVFGVL